MSESLFGERYFATRERLADVMRGIADLAGETHTDLQALLPQEALNPELRNPLLFVVCGEVNAGKSSLINGLFGRDLCRVNILPETHRVLFYQYGSPARDVEVVPLLEERFRPIDFLKKFSIIDTPGTNSAVQGHQEITARFLPAADFILFVFPVTNPWAAATWDAISRVPQECLSRVVLIIQQSDQRDPADIQVILGHMADLAMKRIGQVPPIFAVSGKLAYDSKQSSPFRMDKLKASGILAIEDFISETICQSPSRRQALEVWRGKAAAALRLIEDRIEDQTRSLNTQSRFIEQVEREIDQIREQFVKRLPTHLAGVAEVFETEGIWVTRLLRKRLRALPSLLRLFTGDRTGSEMETVFIDRLQAAVEAVAEKDGGEVVNACEDHWEDLGARVKQAMGIDLNAADPIDETLALAKNRFVTRLGRAACQGIGSLKVRNQLDKELRRRNLALKSFLSVALVLIITGASCGALGVPWLPGILCGVALLFLTGGILAAWATRNAISRDFQERLLDTCGAFASTLPADYEEALRVVFRDYAVSINNVRTHLAHEKLAIEPRLKRWKDLFLTLKAIEQEL